MKGAPEALWEKIGGFCAIEDWHPGTFDAKDASDADAEGAIASIYKAGLDQIGAMNQ